MAEWLEEKMYALLRIIEPEDEEAAKEYYEQALQELVDTGVYEDMEEARYESKVAMRRRVRRLSV